MTATLTAKTIRAAATSVAGARGMGIVTAASDAAPDLLERAEAVLSSMLARAAGMEPSSPNQDDERRYYAAASMADAYMAAIDELRAALGLETHAAINAAARAARNQAARDAAETRAAEDAAAQAETAAAEQATRTESCDDMTTLVVDSRGQRVAIAAQTLYSEGRFSSCQGWNEGGDVMARRMTMTAEDGLDVTGEIVATSAGEFRLEQPYSRAYPNGGETWHGGKLVAVETTATSDWLPEGAIVPEYRSEWNVAAAWQAADQHQADQAMLSRLAAMPESWLAERSMLVEKLAANPDATHGGWNGGKYSVRRDLLADLESAEAAQQAEKAEKAARMTASPFAALAALKRAA